VRVAWLVAIAACGGSNAAVDASGDGTAFFDAPLIDAPTCAQLPSNSMMRLATPMLRNGPEAYDNGKTGPRVVLKFGPSDYRMWYEAVDDSIYTTVGYATSSDGIAWAKQGVVLSPSATWEGNEVSPNSIVIEGTTLRLYYHAGGSQLVNRRIGTATSADGLTWTKAPDPILDLGPSGAFDDNQVAEPRVMRVGTAYRMYYTGRHATDNRTSLGYATSSDGTTFTKQGQLIDANRWGNFWGGAFVVDRGHWHLWHGVTPDNGTTSYLVYASSADGLTWTDGPNNPVLTQNPTTTAADRGLVGDSVSGYVDGAEYRVMYTGYNSNLGGSQGRFEGICLAAVTSPCP
jgi:predicted GH43/DUF377 family glycosyl hydrolase